MTEPSLRRRSFHKLVTNLSGFVISLATQSMVPRALGPAAYGSFSYVTSFFWQLVAFLNLNSSTAYYTKLSQRQDDRGLVRFYFRIAGAIAAGVALFVAAAALTGAQARLWPGQSLSVVHLGAVWAVLMFLFMLLGDMADAYGLTVYSERVKVAAKVLGLAAVFAMFVSGRLTLGGYFLYQFLFLAVPAAVLAFHIQKERGALLGGPALDRAAARGYLGEFKKFCVPLILFTALSVGEQMLERWMLQKFSGSLSQGYYALSMQVGNFCFIFTSAAIPLLLRENAISVQNKDFDRLRTLFVRSVSVFFSISAFICAFCAVQAGSLTRFLGGSAFAEAAMPVAIMCFYPVHQTLGQLNANLFFSSERITAYRNIGFVTTGLGLAASVFLLAPQKYGGLHLGAAGMAIKMVVVQIVSANLQLISHARYLGVPFRNFWVSQVSTVAAFLTLAALAAALGALLLPRVHEAVRFAVSGVLYAAGALGLALVRPSLISLEPSDLRRVWNFGVGRMGLKTLIYEQPVS